MGEAFVAGYRVNVTRDADVYTISGEGAANLHQELLKYYTTNASPFVDGSFSVRIGSGISDGLNSKFLAAKEIREDIVQAAERMQR